MRVLNLFGFILVLFGQPMTTHFVTPKSMPAHSQNLSILFSRICSEFVLFDIVPRLSKYVAKLVFIFDASNLKPPISFILSIFWFEVKI